MDRRTHPLVGGGVMALAAAVYLLGGRTEAALWLSFGVGLLGLDVALRARES